MKIKYISYLSGCLTLFLVGCAENSNVSIPQGKERLQGYVAEKSNDMSEKKQDAYITMHDQSIYSVLAFLEKKDRVSYFLDSKDIPLPNSTFKVKSFEDFVDYIENTTDYTIKEEGVNGKFIKVRPVFKKEILSIFDKPLPISVRDKVVLYAVFNTIRDATGYDVIVDKSLDEFFSESYFLDIRVDSINKFFENFSKKHDLFIDIDNQKKTIEVLRIKKNFFTFNIPFDYLLTASAGAAATSSGGSGSIFSALDKSLQTLKRISTSSTQMSATGRNSIMQSLNKAGQSFDYYINETTGIVYVEATPSLMEDAKQMIKKFKDEVLVNINIKFTIYRITLNKENNYGIDWSLSSLTKDFKLGGSFLLSGAEGGALTSQNTASNALSALDISRPSIFKIGRDDGLTGGLVDVRFLNRFGNVSEIKSFNVMTLNNFKIKQEITKDYEYVSSIKKTKSTSTSESSTESSFDTSNAKSGIVLTVTPKYNALTDNITLSVSPLITSVTLRDFSPSATETVQLATTDLTDVSNNVVLKRGEKIIISGIINETQNDAYNGLAPEEMPSLMQGLVGQKAKSKEREETVVTIEVDISR